MLFTTGGIAMLVLSRERGNSIMVNGPEGGCLITVLEIRESDVSILVSHTPWPGELESWTVTLQLDRAVKVGSTAELTVVDLRGDKVRLGIVASKTSAVHRLEVYEAIKRQHGGDDKGGLSGTPVPRPGGPTPPTLDVRLQEPPAAGDGGE